ncbi:proteoglycan 4-like [Rhipicephalus sanguineus]|uniref:proteoglycan 4-like n=1 Tax=Rhipicephalus sanguineus TaxID=34632 RepID=UPI0020C455B2|nr:proteoglycan 4-like [Rhipicephalus sanguineus]
MEQPPVPPDQTQNNDGANTQQGLSTASQSQPAGAGKVEMASSEHAPTVPQSKPADGAKIEMAPSKDVPTVPRSPPADVVKVEMATVPQSQPADAAILETASKAAQTIPQSPPSDAAKVEMASPEAVPTAPQSPAGTDKIEVASSKDAPTLPLSEPATGAKVEVTSPKPAPMVSQSPPADAAKIEVASSKDAPTVHQSPAGTDKIEVASSKDAPTVHQSPAGTDKIEVASSKEAPTAPQSQPATAPKVEVTSPKAAPMVSQSLPADAAKVEVASSKDAPTVHQSPPADAPKIENGFSERYAAKLAVTIPKSAPTVPQSHPASAVKVEVASPKNAPTVPQSPPSAAAKVEVASPEAATRTRLCHLVRRPDFEGYGFVFLEDNVRKQQFVTSVEPGSPAEAAGLRVKDIIIQVNGAQIEGASHQDVLRRLYSIPNEARLLVADEADFNRYKKHEDIDSLPSVTEVSLAAEAEANRSASKPASPHAGLALASLPPTLASLSAEHGGRQKSVEHTSPNPTMQKLPAVTSGTHDPLVTVKREPSSPTESTLRRRITTDEGYQPSSQGSGRQAISPRAPAPSAASVEQRDESSEQVSVRLPPLDLLELTVRLLLPLRLPLPLLLGVMMTSLLAVYYLYAYIKRPSQN